MVLPFLQAPAILGVVAQPTFTFFGETVHAGGITNLSFLSAPVVSPSATKELVIGVSYANFRLTPNPNTNANLLYGESSANTPAPSVVYSVNSYEYSIPNGDLETYYYGLAHRIYKVPVADFTNIAAKLTFSNNRCFGISIVSFLADFGSGGSTLTLSDVQTGVATASPVTMPFAGISIASLLSAGGSSTTISSMNPVSSILRGNVNVSQPFGAPSTSRQAMKKLSISYGATHTPSVTPANGSIRHISYGWDPA